MRMFNMFKLMRKKNQLTPEEAHEFTEHIKNMASNNLVVQLGSKIDAQRVALESKIDVQNSKMDAQNSKYNLLIALVSAGLTLAIAVGGWLLATVAG